MPPTPSPTYERLRHYIARRILGGGRNPVRYTTERVKRMVGVYGLVGGAQGCGSGALLPAPGILAAVQGNRQDFRALLCEIHGIRELPQHESANLPVNQGEGFGVLADALHRRSEGLIRIRCSGYRCGFGCSRTSSRFSVSMAMMTASKHRSRHRTPISGSIKYRAAGGC